MAESRRSPKRKSTFEKLRSRSNVSRPQTVSARRIEYAKHARLRFFVPLQHSGRTKRAALSMTTLRFWSSGISLLLCVLRKRTAPIMAKLREQQARDPWLLLWLWLRLLLRLGLRLRHARWRA